MQLRPHLHRAVAVAAEVDCLVALAATARECNYVRPQLVWENVLHIKKGTCITLDAGLPLLTEFSTFFLQRGNTVIHRHPQSCGMGKALWAAGQFMAVVKRGGVQ